MSDDLLERQVGPYVIFIASRFLALDIQPLGFEHVIYIVA